jgi:hypothetical protein
MGFSQSQKKMVDASYYLFFADHRHNVVYGGRYGSGAVYLYTILISSNSIEIPSSKTMLRYGFGNCRNTIS